MYDMAFAKMLLIYLHHVIGLQVALNLDLTSHVQR